jgi:hypothetical protein
MGTDTRLHYDGRYVNDVIGRPMSEVGREKSSGHARTCGGID